MSFFILSSVLLEDRMWRYEPVCLSALPYNARDYGAVHLSRQPNYLDL